MARILKIGNIEYWYCENCGFLKKNTELSLIEEKKRYDLHNCDDAYVEYMSKLAEQMIPYLNEGVSLDFGCGKLHTLSDILNKRGIKTEYYDLFYYPLFPEKKFDNIIMVEVFEHLKNPYEELIHLRKYLKDKGKIIIITKPYTYENLEKWWYLRDITHRSFIRNDTLSFWGLPYKTSCFGDIFILECI